MPGGLGGQAPLPQSFFLVLEGGEGSGKTSLLAPLAELLGNHVQVTREPGGTPEGLKLRELLLSSESCNWDEGAELLLLMAARIQNVKRTIMPALSAGYPVLCDRFRGSTLAYQGAGRGLPADLILDLHIKLVGDLSPDLTILLDVDPRVGLGRSKRRLSESGSDEGRFEALDLAFHDRVRANFLAQAAAHRESSIVVDAGEPFLTVKHKVIAGVRSWLSAKGIFPFGYVS